MKRLAPCSTWAIGDLGVWTSEHLDFVRQFWGADRGGIPRGFTIQQNTLLHCGWSFLILCTVVKVWVP